MSLRVGRTYLAILGIGQGNLRVSRTWINLLGAATGDLRVGRTWVSVLQARREIKADLISEISLLSDSEINVEFNRTCGGPVSLLQVVDFEISHPLPLLAVSSTMPSYVTLSEAQEYFANRLHSGLWDTSPVSERNKALAEATVAIDTIRYAGVRASVYATIQAGGDDDAILAAIADQVLEFPRGSDTVVPQAIKDACCEEAFSRLDGKNPDEELEDLAVVSQGYSSVRTTYDRTFAQEHLNAGIVSPRAWRFLKPFIVEVRDVQIHRV